jgi:hypothetical protein
MPEVKKAIIRYKLGPLDEKTKFGNLPLSTKSKQCYSGHYTGLLRFGSMVEGIEYGLLIILMDEAPKVSMSMQAKLCIWYLRFKFGDKGMPLLDNNGEPVKTRNSKPIKCVGQWKDPENANQLHSAIAAIHGVRGQHGPYHDACTDCMVLADYKKFKGCPVHPFQLALIHLGDPSKSIDFKNEMKNVQKIAAERGYKVCGSSTCLPGDYRDAKNYLVSQNSLFDLMFYCIMLIAGRAYLWKIEHLGITGEQFNKDLTVIPYGNIEGLNWWVFGKTDKVGHYFFTWKDNETPKFCFV